jgi:hypothetical protein
MAIDGWQLSQRVRLENAHDFPGCIGKFGRPRYEVIADGEIFDGSARGDQFLSENKRAFPDFFFESARVAPTTDCVVVEGRFKGIQLGSWRGLPRRPPERKAPGRPRSSSSVPWTAV